MSRIPLPERGQPIDLSYIYQIAEAINDISQQLSPTNNRYVTIDTPADGKQSTMSSGVKINAAYVEVYTGLAVNAGDEEPFSYNFPADYKYAPVATATAVNVGNTPAGRNVSVILKSVTTSRVEGTVKINSGNPGGEATVGVNLIIVGIPN
jgi:hypothetical protein